MAELTADQQAQANQLHGAVGWIYPDTSDAAFWDNYFNPSPTLTADEQSTGISAGPADSTYYSRQIDFGGLTGGSTAQDKANSYNSLIGSGYTDQQIRDAANQQFGQQTDADWSYLTGLASGLQSVPVDTGAGNWRVGTPDGVYQSSLIKSLREASPEATQAPGVTLRANKANSAPIDFTSVGNGGLSTPETLSYRPPALSPGNKNTMLASDMYYFDQAGNQMPSGNQTPIQKADYYGGLIDSGYTDAEIRAAANQQFGQQTNDDWSYLTALNALPNDLKTADDKAAAYQDMLDAGYTDEQIRWAASQDYGPQTDADWAYLVQLAGQTANQEPAPSPSPTGPSGYSQAAEETLASIPNATSIAAEYDNGYLINVGSNDDAYQVFVNKDGTVQVQNEPSGLIGGEFA